MADRLGRKQYWTNKYRAPEWGADMHFAMSLSGSDARDFDAALQANTQRVCDEILDLASVYKLATGISILDFGCGTGDLVLRLGEILLNICALGIDVSNTAIDLARSRLTSSSLNAGNIEFCVGDVESLDEASRAGRHFDVIICRDMYYLLDQDEQGQVLSAFKRLLCPGGILYFADLAVELRSLERVSASLISRQHGGTPMTWRKHAGEITFSIVQDLLSMGWRIASGPYLEDSAVAESYRTAANLASPATASVFRELASVASTLVDGKPTVPYFRCFFNLPPIERGAPTRQIGLNVDKDVRFEPQKPVLRKGEWTLPKGKWSLVVGRSGCGKTTFLNLLSGFATLDGVEKVVPDSSTLFMLVQKPVLIEELTVLDNVRLFARDGSTVFPTLRALGLHAEVLRRKADNRLSGGEAQRVALGQAIVAEPKILLLDEPTTGIDAPRKKSFFCDLRRALTGKDITVICVDHEFLSIEHLFDAVYELLDGELIEMHVRGIDHE